MQDTDKDGKPQLNEAISLLASWNLQHLCGKFKEQEVCTRAFRYLTDNDLSELIPKIGPRAIFRSHLLTWRQQQELEKVVPMVVLNNSYENTATVSIKDEVLETCPEEEQSSNQNESISIDLELFEDSDSKTSSAISDSKGDDIPTELKSLSMDVQSVLNNSFDGANVIAYYKENKCLDLHHRKKVVNVIIAAALDERKDIFVQDFHSMNEQLIKLFPSESKDTFYIPRVGNIRARGMLYNKYVNLSRRLRRDGLLGYRRHWKNKRC